MGVYKWILISIISPISIISLLVFPSNSLAPEYDKQLDQSHIATKSITTLNYNDQQNNPELNETGGLNTTIENDKMKNPKLNPMESLIPLIHSDEQNIVLFNDTDSSKAPILHDEPKKLIYSVQNFMVSTFNGIKDSIDQAFTDMPNNDSMDYGYNDGTIRGNGWSEEHPSVESDEIWRRYYTLEK